MFLQEVPPTLWFMAVALDRRKDRLFDFIQEQIRLSFLPAMKTFITGFYVIHVISLPGLVSTGSEGVCG